MAGSYYHIVDEDGHFVDNDEFVGMIENLGDAYEMAEEMYGMIWFLASMVQDAPAITPAEMVEIARQNYKAGLKLSERLADGKHR
jgi:hypothetical protein